MLYLEGLLRASCQLCVHVELGLSDGTKLLGCILFNIPSSYVPDCAIFKASYIRFFFYKTYIAIQADS